jgi:hypothetical protein
MALRCRCPPASYDNDGSALLSVQHLRANDAVTAGQANDNNGPAML